MYNTVFTPASDVHERSELQVRVEDREWLLFAIAVDLIDCEIDVRTVAREFDVRALIFFVCLFFICVGVYALVLECSVVVIDCS